MRTNQEELELLLDKVDNWIRKAQSVQAADALKDVKEAIHGRLAEIREEPIIVIQLTPTMEEILRSPEAYTDAQKRRAAGLPPMPTKVDLEDEVRGIQMATSGVPQKMKVGRLTHEEAQIHRGVPSWVVKMIRFIFFLTLAFFAWVLLIEWLAGDGGTSVTGRIVAATAGLIFLLIVAAYIHEFNQRHP